MSSPVIEAEFTVRDTEYPFTAASAEGDCRVELARMTPREETRFAEFFNVIGTDPGEVLSLANRHGDVEARLLTEYENGGFFEFVVGDDCPALRLAELGALPQRVQGISGEGRIVVDIASEYDTTRIIETFLEEFPAARLSRKEEKETVTPIFTSQELERGMRRQLTDRQIEVLETAFEAGYYDWPRRCTGEDVADELGISSATFSEHIHAAERNILRVIFGTEHPDRVETGLE